MNILKAYFQLIRPVNFLMVTAGYLLMHYAGGKITGLNPWEDGKLTLSGMMALSLGLAAGWGYVVNDMRDVIADRKSHPLRPLVTGRIKIVNAKTFSWVLLLLVLVLSAIASSEFGPWWISPAMLMILALEYGYTHYFRSIPLAGNLVTSVLVSSTIIIPMMLWVDRGILASTDLSLIFELTLIYGGFAFLLTLAREMAKDLEDFQGDAEAGFLSLPLVSGWARASALLRLNLILLILFLGALLVLIRDDRQWVVIYGLLTVLFPIMLAYWLAVRINTPPADVRISQLLKLSMVFGLLSAILL